jgi:hypothetical protein
MPIIEYALFLIGLAAIVVISYSKASFPVKILAVSLIALFVNRTIFG